MRFFLPNEEPKANGIISMILAAGGGGVMVRLVLERRVGMKNVGDRGRNGQMVFKNRHEEFGRGEESN